MSIDIFGGGKIIDNILIHQRLPPLSHTHLPNDRRSRRRKKKRWGENKAQVKFHSAIPSYLRLSRIASIIHYLAGFKLWSPDLIYLCITCLLPSLSHTNPVPFTTHSFFWQKLEKQEPPYFISLLPWWPGKYCLQEPCGGYGSLSLEKHFPSAGK